jgi:hypothetical protein
MSDIPTCSRLKTEMPSPSRSTRTWRTLAVSSTSDAEELLDWAESLGFQERLFIVLNPSGFVVMWR